MNSRNQVSAGLIFAIISIFSLSLFALQQETLEIYQSVAPSQWDIGQTGADKILSDVAMNPATGHLIVVDSLEFGGTVSDWNVPVRDTDTASLFVVDATSGALLKQIPDLNLPDGWGISPKRVAVTDDGVILVLGYEGTVVSIASEDVTSANSMVSIVANGSYRKPTDQSPLYAPARGLYTTGNYSEGTCKVITNRGNCFFLWANSPASVNTFTSMGNGTLAFGAVPGSDGVIDGICADENLSRIIVNSQSNGSKLFTGSPQSGYTQDSSYQTLWNWESSIYVDWTSEQVVVAGLHSDTSALGYTNYLRIGVQDFEGNAIGTGNISVGLYEFDAGSITYLTGGMLPGVTENTLLWLGANGMVGLSKSMTSVERTRKHLVPKPKVVQEGTESLNVIPKIQILKHIAVSDARIDAALEGIFISMGLEPTGESATQTFFAATVDGGTAVTQYAQDHQMTLPEADQGYTLRVDAGGISIIGKDLRGLFYGIQTLYQLFSMDSNGTSLPYIYIEDAPSLGFRGLHVFTGKNAITEQKLLVDVMARNKMNALVLQIDYMEFKSFPNIFYTPWGQAQSEVAELIQYAKSLYIEVIPLITTPAHCEWVFRNNQNYAIAEDPVPDSRLNTPYAYNVTDPNSYVFMDQIFTETHALFQSSWFHLGHDELGNFGRYPYRSLPKTKNELLMADTEHWAQWFAGQDMKLMIWGDEYLAAGEGPYACNAETAAEAFEVRTQLKTLAQEYPNVEFIVCDWEYGVKTPDGYNSIDTFHNENLKTIACTWYYSDNIRNFTQKAIQEGSLGLLQTTWAGYSFNVEGQPQNNAQFEAWLMAGEYSWSGRNDSISSFDYDIRARFWLDWQEAKNPAYPITSSHVKTWKLFK